MSAFLFMISNKVIKQTTTENLEEKLKEMRSVVDNFDFKNYRQTLFESDRAAGYCATIPNIEQELLDRKKGINIPLPPIKVIGYNPKE